MKKLEMSKRLILLLLSGTCLLLETLIFYYYWSTNFSSSITNVTGNIYYYRADLLQIAFYGIMLYFLSHMYGGMRIGYLKNAEVIFSQVFATLAANVLLYAQLSLMAKRLFIIQQFIVMTIVQIAVTIIWNNCAYCIYKSIFTPRKMLLIYGDLPIESILN